MAVTNASRWLSARALVRCLLAIALVPTINPARMPMMVMTISISMRVKPVRSAECGLRILKERFMRLRLSFAQFLFHALAEPLFDHALVIEIPGTGQTLDAREHAGIHTQGDGHRFGGFA